MTGHTKGPWSLIVNSWQYTTVYDKDGDAIARVQINDAVTEDTQYDFEPIKEANARLISAAPDLLEALNDILFEDSDKSEEARLISRIKARAAISKAEGQ